MRMSRLIVHADAALAATANDLLDQFDRPIEEVNLIAGNGEPAAAHDPRPPTADLGHLHGRWLVHEALHDTEQALERRARRAR